MAQLKLLVTVGEVDHIVGIIPLDYKMWEKAHGVSWSTVMHEPAVDHTMWICWHASKRKGVIPADMTYEAFEQCLENMEQVAADPLAPGTSAPSA